MNSSILTQMHPQRLSALLAVAAAVGLLAFFYGIWFAGVTPSEAAGIGLLPFAFALGLRWPAITLSVMTLIVAAEVSQNLIDRYGLPSTTSAMVAGAALVLLLRYMVFREQPLFSWRAVVGLGALLAWAGLGILYARYWSVAEDTTFRMAKDFILVFVLLAFIDNPRRLRIFLATLVATYGAICALGLYRYLTGDPNNFFGFVNFVFVEQRFTGPLPDANFFAAYLAFLIPVCVGRLVAGGSRRGTILAALGLGLLAAGLLLTASRGGLLAVLCGLLLFLIFLSNRSRLRALAIGLATVLLVPLLLSSTLASRYQFLIDPSVAAPVADRAVEGRLASWQVAEQLFYDHPLMGVGVGNFKPHYQQTALDLGLIFRGEGRSAHSLYLEVLSEQGILGLSLLLAVLGVAVATPLAVASRLARSGAVPLAMELRGFAIGLITMLLARAFLHADYPILLWTAVAIGLASPQIYRASLSPRTDR